MSACSKEERKAKLAKAAEDMRETGKTEAAFADSSYAVSLPVPSNQAVHYFLLRQVLCIHAATMVPSLHTHCVRRPCSALQVSEDKVTDSEQLLQDV